MYAWVFSSTSQYIEIALRLLKKFDFSSCVFSTVFTSIFPFYFLRWSLESNWWNSLTKFYSIKSLMTAGVSNILCPFISMPSIDDFSSLLIIHSSLSVSWTSVSLLLTSFHWCCFMFHHFPLHLFYVITFFPTSLISSLFQRFIILTF